jgi:hypothetical protein
MKVTLPNWITGLSGENDGLVFYGYKSRSGMCYSRDWVMPTLTANNTAFGVKGNAISHNTWPNCDSSFRDDLQTYVDAWNLTQLDGRTDQDYSAINIFMKACYAAATANSFDVSTLTVAKFGGTVGDLLGTEDPNVGNLIVAAIMPACGLDLTTLTNPIVAA